MARRELAHVRVTAAGRSRPIFSGTRVPVAAGAAILFAVTTQACDRAPRQPPSADFAEARRELEERGRTDQAAREWFTGGGQPDSARLAEMLRIDSTNASWLEGYVARSGWPTTAQVGKEAVNAAFLIVQHAVHDTAFMRAMLPHIEESYRRGDLDGGAVAMLTDRLEVKAGRPQLYGTQLSLSEYLRLVDSVMRGP